MIYKKAADSNGLLIRMGKSFLKYRTYWLMVIPGVIFYLVFCYLPIYGVQLAFRDYTFVKGIWNSDWVGLENFRDLFRTRGFGQAVRNTLLISFGRLVFEFPVPIVIAILLNEIRGSKIKRIYQTIYTFPHFISWVVAFGIFFNFLSSDGILNKILRNAGSKPMAFFTDPEMFLVLIFSTDLWKTLGWSSIIFLAAISAINPEIVEASVIDGANRFQKIMYVILPGIFPVIAIVLILNIGSMMNAGFDQIFNMYSPNVLSVSDILDTYVYRTSFKGSGSFSTSAAAGLFKSLINLALLLTADKTVRFLGQPGIWR